ncbi:MAG: DUF6175 family protein [Bacteroidales bacterium]|nr:DUF6175 family protein [Bacteroidales bacterium]
MKTSHLLIALALSVSASAGSYLDIVSLEQQANGNATFSVAAMSDVKKNLSINAQESLFHTLFYTGVEGVNNGQPLIEKENKVYTNSYFNSDARYTFYVNSCDEAQKITKVGDSFRCTYHVSIKLSKLLTDLKTNKVYGVLNSDDVSALSATDVENANNLVLPTIIVVPYKRDGESYASILQSDYDRRVAVAKVQDGFEGKHITTVDLQAKIDAVQRRAAYEQNSGSADSNDKQLLLTSGADVYVTVDVNKDIQDAGSRVTLIMKAYETATGNVLASKTATPVRRFQTTATDALAAYAVVDNIQPFLDDIIRNFKPANGTKVVLQFAIDGASATTFNDPAGPNGYSLSNVLRNWVRKNAYQGKYHLQGIMDEAMIFDYVTIPPKDQDGLRMDAAEYGFLLEQYLKEEQYISCSVRIDGNNILVTIH